jgi:ribosomal protein S18 acetylase RimI-like enzyme
MTTKRRRALGAGTTKRAKKNALKSARSGARNGAPKSAKVASAKAAAATGKRHRTERPRAPRVQVSIRIADVRDGEALARLRLQTEQTHARLLPDYFRVAHYRPLEIPNSARLTTAVIFVATAVGQKDPGAVLGYIAMKIVDTPRDPSMTPRRRAHIETIVVDQAYRAAGIGTALMRAGSDWARRQNAVELVLTVWSDNRAAEALYGTLGFQPIARILRRPLDF